ncbi:MAG: acyl-CoA carboxylase subunit beta [Anaerolineae bacterium]|nr:acyl-CoA carboxylase subunit beta [Anaerolineae bacterium]MCB9106609.1 acyl-CoA carboxylase subunit beta [Anaerolineales bacterium]
MSTTLDKIKDLRAKKADLQKGGGEERMKKQHEKGRLTARERIAALTDPDTFQEMHLFTRHRATHFGMDKKTMPAEGVVTGVGTVDGRQVCVASQDFTVSGGTVGEMHADKICQIQDMALKTGSPVVIINDSGGARIQESVGALSGYARIFYRNVLGSGVIPQIAVIAGPCAGGAAYSPALMDFIIMVKGAELFITGPQVIRQVTGEQISGEDLGGAVAQMSKSGNVHFLAENDEHALQICKKLLSFLPANNLEDPPDFGTGHLDISPVPALNSVIPDGAAQPYDVKEVIKLIFDNGDFLEVQELYASNVVIGFARLNGHTVGIVANQPNFMAGVLDVNASDKIAGFVRFCNTYNIPLITFVDVPGYMPGVQQEHSGIIRHGAKVLFAYSSATVPLLTVILRKAYGGAYIAMCSKDLGADRVVSWPTGEIAVMGAAGAVPIVYRNEIKKADDPAAAQQEFVAKYQEEFGNPYLAASRNLIDDVIEPQDTRRYLSLALESLRTKRELRPQKKHGLIPM